MKHLLLAALFLPLAAVAQAKDEVAVKPDEFEKIVTGRVLEYRVTGSDQLVGHEAHLPGRKVVFRYGDGSCIAGEWYPKKDDICFVYDGDPTPNCIRYVRRGKSLAAQDPRQDGITDHFDIKLHKGQLDCAGG
jgi:hypothetical protein